MKAELEYAEHLAREAGRAVMAWYGHASAELKDGVAPVTAADRESDRIIVAGLRARFPEDGILSEESRDTAERLTRERVWVVDPLDGTREFVDGVAEFAVMIGLSVGGSAVLGVVYCPADDELYTAVAGGGAWLERGGRRDRLHAAPSAAGSRATDAGTGQRAGPEDTRGGDARTGLEATRDVAALRLVGSRSHPDPRLVRIQRELGISDVRPSGSVGVKCALIARRERDLYVHPVPYLKEWDTCAPEIILREAGGTVTDCRGEPLRYNKPSPVQPHGILAAAPGVLPLVLETVRAAFESSPRVAVS